MSVDVGNLEFEWSGIENPSRLGALLTFYYEIGLELKILDVSWLV
jgi:hypothetical protein